MAAGQHREIHDVEQTKKMVPLITREITFTQHVSELVFGVNIIDLFYGVQINSVKQPNETLCYRDTRLIVGLPALYGRFDHSFIIFKNMQLSFELRRTCVCDNVIHV